MSDYNKELSEMTWSFSRVKGFTQCKYEWYLHYLENRDSEQNIYAAYGKYCHELLEKYARGELIKDDILDMYMSTFDEKVIMPMSVVQTNIVDKLYISGLEYFDNFNLDLDEYNIIGVELKCDFTIKGKQFTGFIDLLVQHKITKKIIIIDHKSSQYPLGKRGSVLKNKQKEYVAYKRQLYLYAIEIHKRYGVYPTEIWWNYFKEQKWLKLPFLFEEFEEAKMWAVNTIQDIYKEDFFEPSADYFYCKELCGYRNVCEYKLMGGSDS